MQKFNIQPKRSQLSEKDFYMLCQSIMDNTQEGSYIKALSMMLKCEWTNSKEEINFWQANLDAVKRKVLLERIFIVKKDFLGYFSFYKFNLKIPRLSGQCDIIPVTIPKRLMQIFFFIYFKIIYPHIFFYPFRLPRRLQALNNTCHF
mgnify:CR=1 FL=1